MAARSKPPPEPGPRASEIPKDEDVQKALAQTGPGEEVRPSKRLARSRLWLAIWGVPFLGFATIAFLLQQGLLTLPGTSFNWMHRLPAPLAAVFGLFFAERAIEHFGVSRLSNQVYRYNLTRILRLIMAIAIVGVLGSILFGNLYTGLVSLGVISLIVGLAVQTPMTSFIGWLYILIRTPYRVGDRIQIGQATGDVIEVSYLDTTLWEFGGKYLSSDHPSGRIIRFPNSSVLNTPVFNYSWPLFPYIWNEIRIQVAYQSDLEFVADTMLAVAEKQLGKEMTERVKVYRKLLAKTPVDELTVQEKPVVLFRASENTWLEAVVRYLVDPRRAGRVKTALLRELLEKLNEEPDRAMLPRGNSR